MRAYLPSGLNCVQWACGSFCRPAFGPLPAIAGIWAYQAWRLDGFVHLREFFEDETP